MRVKLLRPKAVAALSLLLALPLSGCPGDPPEDLDHGTVRLQMLRGESEGSNPYVGTAKIEVTLIYLECLIDFYEANPNYLQDGPDGAPVFGTAEDGGEGWLDRLCDDDSVDAVPCTVDSFDQEFSSQSRHLRVVYTPTGDIEQRYLPFGPIPLPELAQCNAGLEPIVRVGNSAARGLDGNGNTVWTTESFNPDKAAVGQGAPIKISAASSAN